MLTAVALRLGLTQFDIVKVRLQSSNTYPSALVCATRILREEGPAAFYKGTTMPLFGIGLCVSLQFAILQAGKTFFTKQNGSDRLTSTQLYLAGAGAGLGNSVVSGPVEHIRIRLQTQTSNLYHGPLDALKKIYASDGLRGVYQGQVSTVARESYGYGVYFLAYEAMIQKTLDSNGWSRKDVPMGFAAGFGAISGGLMWLLDYPIDVIKSRMQTDGFPSQPHLRKYPTVVSCAKSLYQEGGLKIFTRGLSPTLIRSPFVNGATFAVFELTMKALEGETGQVGIIE